MKAKVTLLGLTLLCVGALLGPALFSPVVNKAQAATTVGGPYGSAVILSSRAVGSSGDYGTNYGGEYPSYIAATTGLVSTKPLFVGTGPRVCIEVQGQTVSSTGGLIVYVYKSVTPVTFSLNPATQCYTNSGATPWVAAGSITNSCTTTKSSTIVELGDATAIPKGACPYWYVGYVTNNGAGVITNYSVTAIGGTPQ